MATVIEKDQYDRDLAERDRRIDALEDRLTEALQVIKNCLIAEEKLLTVTDLAKIFNVTKGTMHTYVNNWILDGTLIVKNHKNTGRFNCIVVGEGVRRRVFIVQSFIATYREVGNVLRRA